MKRRTSTLCYVLFLLALSACAVVPASPSAVPSPTATIQPSRPDDSGGRMFTRIALLAWALAVMLSGCSGQAPKAAP